MVVNLGDIVGYGASNEVIERSRALGHIFVRGNHDKACQRRDGSEGLQSRIAGLAALWTRDQLTPQNLKWLLGLPHGPIQTGELPDIAVCARFASG